MLTNIHHSCLPLHLTLVQLLFTRQPKSFALYEGTFHLGDYTPALYFNDAIVQTNMKDRAVLPIVHQQHRQLIFHTQLRGATPAVMLAMGEYALLHYFYHLYKGSFLYSRQSLKSFLTDLLHLFPIHIP